MKRVLQLGLLAAAVFLFAANRLPAAGVPELINYQGKLVNGAAVYNGPATIILSLYTNAALGSAVYACSNTATVADGVYSVWLGSNTISPGSLRDALALPALWLEVAVNGSAMLPRERLGAVPYSLNPAYASINSLVATNPADVLTITGINGIIVTSQPPATIAVGLDSQRLVMSNLIWVACNGSSNGPGSFDRPYDTPQGGYDAAVARFGGAEAVVAIVGGVVATDLFMNAFNANIHVVGIGRPRLNNLAVSAISAGRKQRIEGLVMQGSTVVPPGNGGVKFDNCRMEGAVALLGAMEVEFQNCYITAADSHGLMLMNSHNIAVYNTSIEINNEGFYAVDISDACKDIEFIGNEIVNPLGTAIWDAQAQPLSPAQANHLYAFNYIKGKPHEEQPHPLAVYTSGTNTVAFYQNLVFGDVGNPVFPGQGQYYANNSVLGVINAFNAPNVAGWAQWGAGAAPDNANNTEHFTAYPTVPDEWDD